MMLSPRLLSVQSATHFLPPLDREAGAQRQARALLAWADALKEAAVRPLRRRETAREARRLRPSCLPTAGGI